MSRHKAKLKWEPTWFSEESSVPQDGQLVVCQYLPKENTNPKEPEKPFLNYALGRDWGIKIKGHDQDVLWWRVFTTKDLGKKCLEMEKYILKAYRENKLKGLEKYYEID